MWTRLRDPRFRRRVYFVELAVWTFVGVPLSLWPLANSVRWLNFMSVYALVLALRVTVESTLGSSD